MLRAPAVRREAPSISRRSHSLGRLDDPVKTRKSLLTLVNIGEKCQSHTVVPPGRAGYFRARRYVPRALGPSAR